MHAAASETRTGRPRRKQSSPLGRQTLVTPKNPSTTDVDSLAVEIPAISHEGKLVKETPVRHFTVVAKVPAPPVTKKAALAMYAPFYVNRCSNEQGSPADGVDEPEWKPPPSAAGGFPCSGSRHR